MPIGVLGYFWIPGVYRLLPIDNGMPIPLGIPGIRPYGSEGSGTVMTRLYKE